MKSLLKQKILALLEKFSFIKRSIKMESLPLYPDFETALLNCDSYDDGDICAIVSEKTKRFSEHLSATISDSQQTQTLLAFQTILNLSNKNNAQIKKIDVLDIGGACGANYFLIDFFAKDSIRRWAVLETKKMKDIAIPLFASNVLQFCDSFEDALGNCEGKDLCMMLGVLQFLPDPIDTFQKVLNSGFQFLYLDRHSFLMSGDEMLISSVKSDIAHHGPGHLPQAKNRTISLPVWLIPKRKILEMAQEAGYEIVYECDILNLEPYICGGINIRLKNQGMVFSKRNTN
jgi:putative methyltransferase (TIGR04325 family)